MKTENGGRNKTENIEKEEEHAHWPCSQHLYEPEDRNLMIFTQQHSEQLAFIKGTLLMNWKGDLLKEVYSLT